MGTISLPDKIAKKVTNVPTLSTVAARLIEVTGDDRHTLAEVVNIVNSDASLTSQVLRVANSAAFAAIKEITTLDDAIKRLGEKLVIGIAIGACSPQLFGDRLEGYATGSGVLWDHSLRTAIASREIASFAKNKSCSRDLAFTSGLLLDLGKSVVSEFFKGKIQKMTKLYDQGEVSDYLGAENEIIGTNHAEVGYAIAKNWKLPDILCMPIRYHHVPSEAPEDHRTLVFATHLGDWVAMMAGGLGVGSDSFSYKLDQRYKDFIELNISDLDKIILLVQEEFTALKSSIIQS